MPIKYGNRFESRVCLVTGSSAGIGYAIAKRLALEGGIVIVSSRKADKVDEAVKSIIKAVEEECGDKNAAKRVVGIPCHVGDEDQRKELIRKIVELFGGIDVLVNNVAVSPAPGPLVAFPDKAWDKLFEINVKVPLLMVQLALPHMLGRKGANVMFISSIAGYNPAPPLAAYGITKTTLFGLTKALSMELGPQGIRVNCIAPGVVKTRFSSLLWKGEESSEYSSNGTHLGRFANADEISGAAAYACSDDGSYFTGETIRVTGGMPSSL